MIHQKPDQQLCDDVKLIAVLQDGDEAAELQQMIEHIEQCPRCQKRLDELAARAQDWTKARQALLNDDPGSENRAGSAKWDYSLRNEGPVAWTESMASQLLSPPSHPELLGRMGRYDVERLIGSGGMGVVFKAHDSELNRPVAIKILAPYLSSSGPARKRFAREARAAAAVVHEHVVPIYNVETEREIPFLVMHYIAGESLQGRIDREGALELCEILRIGMQVASGLSAAHGQGLVHRDIKPSNILMEQGVERALITDFGLARAADDASLTRTGFHPGTPQYMSPEQAAGEQVDARSDLFSLGSVLYTMCTGRPPFRAETSLGVLRRITDVEPRPIREINPHIPDWLCAIINKLMAKQSNSRFESAEQVAELLRGCIAHVQSPTNSRIPTEASSLVPHRSSALIRFLTGVFVMSCISLLAILFFTQVNVDNMSSIDQGNAASVKEVNVSAPPAGDDDKATPTESPLRVEARKALQVCQESLSWKQKFEMRVTNSYVHRQVGKVTIEGRVRRDAPRMVEDNIQTFDDQPKGHIRLDNWCLDDGEMFIGRTTTVGQRKLTGLMTIKGRQRESWRMIETSSFAMEGHFPGNQGRTLMELLLESKEPDVRMEKIGDHDCLRISDRNDWGTMTVWIDAGPSRRLRQWESSKERGNRFAEGRVGEDKDTANLESFSHFVEDIQYQLVDGIEIAVSCRLRSTSIPNGGTKQVTSAEYRRTEIHLQPDFGTNNPFVGDFDNGARINDGDAFDRDTAFRWQDGKLNPSKPKPSVVNESKTSALDHPNRKACPDD